MMNQQNSTANQVQQLVSQLNAALLRKESLAEQLAAAEDQVKALRNVVAGIEMGQKLAAEVADEKAKAEGAAKKPPPITK